MRALLLASLLAIAAPAAAQSTGFDRLTPSLPTAGERHAADIASWGTAIAAVTLDGVATWRQHCRSQWDECEGAIVRSGLRVGITYGAAFLVKRIVQRSRPCAPDCGIDDPSSSFYSAHTAIAFSTVGGSRLAFSLPLAVGTGGLRVAAGKHWLTDTLVGAGAGLLVSRIR